MKVVDRGEDHDEDDEVSRANIEPAERQNMPMVKHFLFCTQELKYSPRLRD